MHVHHIRFVRSIVPPRLEKSLGRGWENKPIFLVQRYKGKVIESCEMGWKQAGVFAQSKGLHLDGGMRVSMSRL